MAARLGLLTVVAAGALAVASSANARNAVVEGDPVTAFLSYTVYFGGAQVAGLDIDIDLARRAYDVKVRLRTVGLIGRLFPWRMKAHAEGEVRPGDVTPRRAGQRNHWRGRDRRVELSYRGGQLVRTTVEPAPDDDERAPVPVSLRRDTLDLASAILRVVLAMDRGGRCTGRVPVFDGRRRYDMVLAHETTRTLSATRYSPFQGQADNCRVTMDRIGGFRNEDEQGYDPNDPGHAEGSSSGWRARRGGSVWIGRIVDRAPPMPVRLAFDTRFGAVRAHLARARIDAGGVRRLLSLGR